MGCDYIGMINVLVMTGTVNVNGCEQLVRADACTRAVDYYIAVRWFLENTGLRLVFVENSGHNLQFLEGLQKGYPERLELLSFLGNNFPRHWGKGYGERVALNYAIEYSKFLERETYFGKMTGRLYIENMGEILQILDSWRDQDIDFVVMVNTVGETSMICTEFLVARKDYFYEEINRLEMDDSRGRIFENGIAEIVNKNPGRSKMINREFVKIRGFQGTSNKEYVK